MYTISDEQFDRLITQAMNELPQEYITGLENVVITMADEPTPEQVKKMKLREGTVLLGLYEGVPLTQRGNGWSGMLPDKITLFKHSILEVVQSDEALFAQIKRTLWHEIAHYYGLNHQDMEQRMASPSARQLAASQSPSKRQTALWLVVAILASAGLIAIAYWLDGQYQPARQSATQSTAASSEVTTPTDSTASIKQPIKQPTDAAAADMQSTKQPANTSQHPSTSPAISAAERQAVEQRDGCQVNDPACSVSIATAIQRLQQAGYIVTQQTDLHYSASQRIQAARQVAMNGKGVTGIVVDLYRFQGKQDMWYALQHPVGGEFDYNGFGLYGTPALYVSVHPIPGVQQGTASEHQIVDAILQAITT